MVNSSTHDRRQLIPSIQKLFHYIFSHVVEDTTVTVFNEDSSELFKEEYHYPESISISPTLYTRLDDCHGAGNCCRVPFDLVYTRYDYERIISYDEGRAIRDFGVVSADNFTKNRELLLNSLVCLNVQITSGNRIWDNKIYVQKNTEVFKLSGNKSCPYLFIGDDRYFCGVHPFKPLHCWYPHMVVRSNFREGCIHPSVVIGRMQYGRNHKFGCPVLFERASIQSNGGIFEDVGDDGRSYFSSQFKSDIDKLQWTADSAASLGFFSSENVANRLGKELANLRDEISHNVRSGLNQQIEIWRK